MSKKSAVGTAVTVRGKAWPAGASPWRAATAAPVRLSHPGADGGPRPRPPEWAPNHSAGVSILRPALQVKAHPGLSMVLLHVPGEHRPMGGRGNPLHSLPRTGSCSGRPLQRIWWGRAWGPDEFPERKRRGSSRNARFPIRLIPQEAIFCLLESVASLLTYWEQLSTTSLLISLVPF